MCLLGVMMSMYHAFYLSDPGAGRGAAAGGAQPRVAHGADSAGISVAHQADPRRAGGDDRQLVRRHVQGQSRPQEHVRALRRRAGKTVHGLRRDADSRGPEEGVHSATAPAASSGATSRTTHGFKVGDRIPHHRRHLPRQLRVHRARHLRLAARQRRDVHQQGVRRAVAARAAARRRSGSTTS